MDEAIEQANEIRGPEPAELRDERERHTVEQPTEEFDLSAMFAADAGERAPRRGGA
jgi:hypothetical protein